MVGLTTPAFNKLPTAIKEYSVKRMFEIAKFYYPIGMPLELSPEIKRKMVEVVTKEISVKFKIKVN